MTYALRVILDLTISDDAADPEEIGQRVFDLVGNDPDHLIDEIETTDGFDVEVLP